MTVGVGVGDGVGLGDEMGDGRAVRLAVVVSAVAGFSAAPSEQAPRVATASAIAAIACALLIPATLAVSAPRTRAVRWSTPDGGRDLGQPSRELGVLTGVGCRVIPVNPSGCWQG